MTARSNFPAIKIRSAVNPCFEEIENTINLLLCKKRCRCGITPFLSVGRCVEIRSMNLETNITGVTPKKDRCTIFCAIFMLLKSLPVALP